MKTVSETQLKRLKKKGKVRRKMGVQPEKKPGPVAAADVGMSGSTPTEQPVPAPSVQQTTPEKPVADQPMASMAASMAMRDGLMESLIENNTRAIEAFRQALTEQKPRVGVGYRHKVVRDKKSSLIDEVISTPMES